MRQSPGGSSWRGSWKNNQDASPSYGMSGSWGAALRDHFPMKNGPGRGGHPTHDWGKRGVQTPGYSPQTLLSGQPPWTSSCNLQLVLEAHMALGSIVSECLQLLFPWGPWVPGSSLLVFSSLASAVTFLQRGCWRRENVLLRSGCPGFGCWRPRPCWGWLTQTSEQGIL